MNLRQQLRWGGLWIMISSVFESVAVIVIYAGKQSATMHLIYSIGYTALVLTCAFIHISQARRSGIFGLVTYIACVLTVLYLNILSFLIQADLAGIEGARQATRPLLPPMTTVNYVAMLVWILFGLSVAQAGVFPRWGGILIALGVALLAPTAFAMNLAGQVFYIFTIGASIIYGIGKIWLGWALWSGKGMLDEEPRLSHLDRTWGAPFVILTALLLAANAYINTFSGLTLAGAIINVATYTALIFAIVILYTAQADRAGGLGLAGFISTHLGATLFYIPAYLVMAQLAGQIDSNRALMIVWNDVPVGKIGNYMIPLGLLLFGVSVIRAEVFPRWTGWLMVIGVALILPTQFQSQAYLFQIFWFIGATLVGIGMGWMGWRLLKKNPLVE